MNDASQLCYKVAEVMFLKLGIDMAISETQYAVVTKTNRDEAPEDICAFIDGVVSKKLRAIKDKLPKKTIGAPVDCYKTGDECSAYADGYNNALEDVAAILNKHIDGSE